MCGVTRDAGQVAQGVGDLADFATATEVAAGTNYIGCIVIGGGDVGDIGTGAVFYMVIFPISFMTCGE